MAPAGIDSFLYGGVQNTNQQARDNIWNAISRHERFEVHNSTMYGDPVPGHRKQCIIDFRTCNDGPLQRRSAWEGETIDFAFGIESITYGGLVIKDRAEIYERFCVAQLKDYKITVNNENLGCDPAPGETKKCRVDVRYRQGGTWDMPWSERSGESTEWWCTASEDQEVWLDGIGWNKKESWDNAVNVASA